MGKRKDEAVGRQVEQYLPAQCRFDIFGEFALFLGIFRNKSVMMEFQVMYYVLCYTIGGEGKKENKVLILQKFILNLRSLCVVMPRWHS